MLSAFIMNSHDKIIFVRLLLFFLLDLMYKGDLKVRRI